MQSESEKIKNLLIEAKTIAVVGASRNREKPAYKVPAYLKEKGYKILPVNPNADEILGEKAYKSIDELAEEVRKKNIGVDIFDIFRPSEECYEIVKKIIKAGLKPEAIWLQLGIKNEEAKKLAEKHGIAFIQDRCMMIEHKKIIQSRL